MSDSDMQVLTYDEAVALLPDGDTIHTLRDGSFVLISEDRSRAQVLELLEATARREVTGSGAQSTGHGLAAFRADGTPVFIETRPAS